MIAKDVMTTDPVTLTKQATIEDAMDLMRERGIRHVPIVDRDGVLIGVVSDRDLALLDVGLLVADDPADGLRRYLATPIVKVMTSEVLSLGPDDGLGDLVDLMLESRVGAVPIVDEPSGRIIGIVSYLDVLRSLRDLAG